MTSNKQLVSQVAIAYALLLFLGSRNQIGRTIWVLLNLRDTLRALKEVYPNGRRIGVVTRRRRLRAALAGWIVLVTVQPITFAADTLLSWVPFYSSIKMLLVLVHSFWRLESSAFLFQTLVVPFVRRYETHIDLTLLLVGSTVLFIFHFLVELPWRALVALIKRPSRRVLHTPAREAPAPRIVTPVATPSRPRRQASPSPEPPVVTEAQKGSKRKSLAHTSPRRPRGPREPEAEKHHAPSAAPKKSAVLVAKSGRVRAAAQAFESSSAASASDRERPRATTSGRSKKAEAPYRASASLAEITRPTRAARSSDKPVEAQPRRPVPSSKTANTRPDAHAAKLRAALRTLPPAPSHDPQQPPVATSQRPKSHNPIISASTSQAEPKRPARGQKRTRADDDEYQDSDASTARSTHAMSTRSTPRKAKATKATAAAGPVKRVKAAREPAKRTRAAVTTTKADMPRVKRARTSKK